MKYTPPPDVCPAAFAMALQHIAVERGAGLPSAFAGVSRYRVQKAYREACERVPTWSPATFGDRAAEFLYALDRVCQKFGAYNPYRADLARDNPARLG